MKNRIKKTVALLLIVVMLLSIIPIMPASVTTNVSAANDVFSSYNDVVNEFKKTAYSFKGYSLFDIDNDGKEELIIIVTDYEMSATYLFYQKSGNSVLKVGEEYSTGQLSSYLGDLYFVYNSYLERISIQNGNIKTTVMDYDGISDMDALVCNSLENYNDVQISAIYHEYKKIFYNYDWYSRYSYYFIYDIDKDGTTELIIHSGTCEGDRKYTVYTYNGISAIKIGEAEGWHSNLYGIKNENGMYISEGYNGTIRVDKIYVEKKCIKRVNFIDGITMDEYEAPENAEKTNQYELFEISGLNSVRYASQTKLHVGKFIDLSYKETDDESGTWSSSDETVARVSQDGMVSAIKKGTATIKRNAKMNTFTTNVSVCDDSDCTWKITQGGSDAQFGKRAYFCTSCGEVIAEEEFKDNLRVSMNNSNLSYVKGDKIYMAVSDFINTQEINPENLSVKVSDNSIIKVKEIKNASEMAEANLNKFENSKIIAIETRGIGSASVSLTNSQTGHTRKIPILVSEDEHKTLRANQVGTHEYKCGFEKDKFNANFGGVWVSDFSYKKVSGGWSYSMNIYNENYSNAVLEVYNKEGKLIDVRIIDKFESLTKGLWKTAVAGWKVVEDVIDGDSLSFRADTTAKHTPIKDLLVPQDGIIRITSDSSVSANCAIVNAFDIAFTCWTFTSDISEFITGIEKFDQDSAKKLTKAALFKLMAQEEYLNFAKKFQDKFIGSLGTDLSLDVLVNLSNTILTEANILLFRGLDVSFNDIVNMALGTGASVAEGLFLKLSGLYGAILKGMFMTQDISDWTLEVNNTMKRITGETSIGWMTPFEGTSSSTVLKNEDVTVDTKGNVPNETIMQSFRIARGNQYERAFLKIIDRPIEDYETYEIALYNDGSVVQPNGKVEVSIASPYRTATVYRQKADGSWEYIESRIKNGMVVFEVDHFCKFVVAKEEAQEQPDDPSATCTHICHKGGISAFFYKIVRFFWKLFKTNKYCSCGAAHY